jgi:hypothetical protein
MYSLTVLTESLVIFCHIIKRMHEASVKFFLIAKHVLRKSKFFENKTKKVFFIRKIVKRMSTPRKELVHNYCDFIVHIVKFLFCTISCSWKKVEKLLCFSFNFSLWRLFCNRLFPVFTPRPYMHAMWYVTKNVLLMFLDWKLFKNCYNMILKTSFKTI